MSLVEVADLGLSPHQLNDLGFTFDILASMGGNVKTFKDLDMSVEDIKTYFTPNGNQWADAGFYDKEKLERYGWDVGKVSRVLPAATDRICGRHIRLAF
jgi:hypothetical protein